MRYMPRHGSGALLLDSVSAHPAMGQSISVLPDARHAVRGRDPDRQPRRHHAASLRVLARVSVIAAEDTRRTARLLSHHSIATRTISFHEHNTGHASRLLASSSRRATSVALVTDAGTPGVSDPGLELVQAAIENGIPIESGARPERPTGSAVASGFPLAPFAFLGFPPIKV